MLCNQASYSNAVIESQHSGQRAKTAAVSDRIDFEPCLSVGWGWNHCWKNRETLEEACTLVQGWVQPTGLVSVGPPILGFSVYWVRGRVLGVQVHSGAICYG